MALPYVAQAALHGMLKLLVRPFGCARARMPSDGMVIATAGVPAGVMSCDFIRGSVVIGSTDIRGISAIRIVSGIGHLR